MSSVAAGRHAAEATFRQLGITFAVYGESEASERIIPFDIVPRVFLPDEWARLSEGLVQRVEAINAFLDDIYGERRILKESVLPEDLILGNPQFRPEIAGIRPPHDVWAHICGIDLVRTGPDAFFVLEDNARTPSGVSYMLENREAMVRLCPELFGMFRVAAVDSYPDLLLQTMRSVAPKGFGHEHHLRGPDAGPLQLPPITSTAFSPTRWGSNWSRRRTSWSTTTWSICGRLPGGCGST